MSDRRNRPPNRWGCKPTEDVCVEHDRPLDCRHTCPDGKKHECKQQREAQEQYDRRAIHGHFGAGNS